MQTHIGVSLGHDQRADFVEPHEAAVAFDIGCEDRREFPFDRVGFRRSAPPQPEYSPTKCQIREVSQPILGAGGETPLPR